MTHSIKTQGHGEQSRTMITIFKKDKTKHGYAILELLFYISFFAIFSIVVINSMIIMTKSFRETTIQAEFLQSGAIMERMSREIRQASSIISISTTVLKLNAVEFKLNGSDIQFLENNVFTGNLNAPNITVMGLTFTQITTVKGKAVKIILSVRSNNDSLNRTVDFYDTVVLRGGY